MGYIVTLPDQTLDLVKNASYAQVFNEGHLRLLSGDGNTVLATYAPGAWTSVRLDGEVVYVDGQERIPVAIGD